jgi:hypothetical protein
MINAVLVVRVAGGDESGVAADVRQLFPHEVRFVDSGDPYSLQMARLTFGLPAFAFHALDEGRTVAQILDAGWFRDLWPVTDVHG